MLTDTVERLIRSEKRRILRGLQKADKFGIALELLEEPGEVLITRLMKAEDITKSVEKATARIFLHGDIQVEEAISRDNFLFIIFKKA